MCNLPFIEMCATSRRSPGGSGKTQDRVDLRQGQ